jgi:hypothetical protein
MGNSEDAFEAARRFVELVFKQNYGPGNFGPMEFWDAMGALVPMAQQKKKLSPGAVAALRHASLGFFIRPGANPAVIKANIQQLAGEPMIDDESFKLVVEYLRTQVNGEFESFSNTQNEAKKRFGGEF